MFLRFFDNRKIAVSALIGLIAAGAIIGGTIAYFSDTETSVGNTFRAGKMDLKIDNTCHYNGKECINGKWENTQESCACNWSLKDLNGELFFHLSDIKPGDGGEDTIGLHIDDNPAWVCVEIKNLANDDNGCEEPESDVDQSCGSDEGELQENLLFSAWKDNGAGNHACNNIKDSDEGNYIIENQPARAGIWPLADSTTGLPLPGGSTICYGVKWIVPHETANIIQGDSLVGDAVFTAIQARHADNFKCSDLTPAECIPTNGGIEICGNGVDEDCNGSDLECPPTGECLTVADCNDNNVCTIEAACKNGVCIRQDLNCDDGNTCTVDTCDPVHRCQHIIPPEACNGVDDDCDGEIDEPMAIGCKTYLPDADNDGYGQNGISICLCGSAGIYTEQGMGGDCNDNDSSIHPLATEICNDQKDNDCDNAVDCADSDCVNNSACRETLTCAAAQTISCGASINGNTADSGSTDIINAYGGNCDNWNETGREYVYSFTSPINGTVRVALSNMVYNLDIFVMDSQCVPSSCIKNHNATVDFVAEQGKTYYFSVDGNHGEQGSYTITVTCF